MSFGFGGFGSNNQSSGFGTGTGFGAGTSTGGGRSFLSPFSNSPCTLGPYPHVSHSTRVLGFPYQQSMLLIPTRDGATRKTKNFNIISFAVQLKFTSGPFGCISDTTTR